MLERLGRIIDSGECERAPTAKSLEQAIIGDLGIKKFGGVPLNQRMTG